MFRSYRSIMMASVATLALAGTVYAAPAKAKAHSVVGTLEKVDGQTVTVQTSKGEETLMLVSSSRIRRAAATIQASNLSSYTGQKLKARYVERNGEKEIQSVSLASETSHGTPKASKN